MKKKFTFLWIDDDAKKRRPKFNSLRMKLGHKDSTFIDVKGENIPNKLDNLFDDLRDCEPDFIIIDHKLSQAEAIKTGSTAAEKIRESWLDCPIICVTAYGIDEIKLHRELLYEEIIPDKNFSEYYSTIKSIAESFYTLKRYRPKNVDDLLRLIKIPKDDLIRVKSIIPEILRLDANYKDKSLLLSISHWVRNILIKRPGFLYDRLWAATLLGINENSFKKVEPLFEEAKYEGIFKIDGQERWWQSRLREILYSKFPTSPERFTWRLGHKLTAEMSEKDISKCPICKKDFPETVAYRDQTNRVRQPMHLRCTIPHPDFDYMLYFEEIRMMKPAE